jgi:hypothetical protein
VDEDPDTNESIWKSDQMVTQWVEGMTDRESRRIEQRRLMADLLPSQKTRRSRSSTWVPAPVRLHR